MVKKKQNLKLDEWLKHQKKK